MIDVEVEEKVRKLLYWLAGCVLTQARAIVNGEITDEDLAKAELSLYVKVGTDAILDIVEKHKKEEYERACASVYDDAYAQGHEDGSIDLTAVYLTAYEKGKDEGYSEGYEEGRTRGNRDCY